MNFESFMYDLGMAHQQGGMLTATVIHVSQHKNINPPVSLERDWMEHHISVLNIFYLKVLFDATAR